MKFRLLLLGSLAGLLFTQSVAALELPIQDDAFTLSTAISNNYGAEQFIGVRNDATSYLKFDFSRLPPGTTSSDIVQATLRLYVANVATPGSVSSYTG